MKAETTFPSYDGYHLAKLKPEELDGGALLTLVPPGYTGHFYLPERPLPRVKQSVTVEDTGALEDYLRHQVIAPQFLAVYVNTASRSFLAVLDHCQRADVPGTNQHTVQLKLACSEEFAPLQRTLDKEMAQVEFMEFLEHHASLFVEAGPLLQMVQTFSNVTITTLKSARNLDNGTGQLVYTTEEDAEASTKVPREVSAVMPIFHGQPPVTLRLRLRYFSRGGKVMFMLLCPGLESLLREQVLAVELRLREWIKARAAESADWEKVLIVRAAVALLPPAPSEWHEMKSTALPAPLTSGMR